MNFLETARRRRIDFIALPLLGCPYCNSDVSREVAAQIFDEQFVNRILLLSLPLSFILLVILSIHFGNTVARLFPRKRDVE